MVIQLPLNIPNCYKDTVARLLRDNEGAQVYYSNIWQRWIVKTYWRILWTGEKGIK